MRSTDHVARMGSTELDTGLWWGNLKEGEHMGDQGTVGKMLLKCILKKQNGVSWTGIVWLRMGICGGLL